MSEKPLVFLDSGVGGLSFIHPFFTRCGGYPVYYVADTECFPYGQKDADFLRERILTVGKRIWEKWQPRLLVIACNTASVVALSSLRRQLPQLSIVGVVPAIKPAVTDGRRTAVLATSVTTAHGYTAELLSTFARDTQVSLISHPELVQFIEDAAPVWDHRDIVSELEKVAERVNADDIHHLVLGCTHFFHLRSLLQQMLPAVTCYDAVQGVVDRMRTLLGSPSEASLHLYCTALHRERQWQDIAASFSAEFSGLL